MAAVPAGSNSTSNNGPDNPNSSTTPPTATSRCAHNPDSTRRAPATSSRHEPARPDNRHGTTPPRADT
ncbi:hypothetical protein [Streptomyces sp. NPDC055709]